MARSGFIARSEYERVSKQAGEITSAWRQSLDEIDKLMKMLGQANSLLRSAYKIAERQGRKTNWSAFQKRVHAALEKQHDVLNDYHDDQ